MVAAAALEPFTRVTMLARGVGHRRPPGGDPAAVRSSGPARSLDMSVLFAIGSALLIGRAMESSGLAAAIAGGLSGVVNPSNPRVMLAARVSADAALHRVARQCGRRALVFPIAHAWTAVGRVTLSAVRRVDCRGCVRESFASPLGYQTHLMVYGVGGYRFSDFARIGVPLDLVAMALTVAIAPLAFPF